MIEQVTSDKVAGNDSGSAGTDSESFVSRKWAAGVGSTGTRQPLCHADSNQFLIFERMIVMRVESCYRPRIRAGLRCVMLLRLRPRP